MFLLRLLVRTFFSVAVYGLLLFVPARTLHWWHAWIVLALVFIGMIVTRLWVFRGEHEALLRERRKPPIQRGQPLADKFLIIGFVVIFPMFIAFIPLDVFWLHLMGRPPLAVSSLGLVLFVAGMLTISLAFRENAFAAAIVKHQEERGQIVIDTGLYGIVRHPLYLGVVLLIIGIALWLQSYAAAVVAIGPIALLVTRILVEEAFLRRRLAGYVAYSKRVRKRLIPLVW